ncbi:MAG: accessory factor UbiK family protein [Gammaproteobacteria bacterium]|nr:accessory factor UbiK family protein [Gammaproteobacteria bacterium]
MIDKKIFDDISQRIAGQMPSGLQILQDDLKKNIRSAVEASLSNLNLVTREEFDVQAKVLARTRAKLELLEKQVAELESIKK